MKILWQEHGIVFYDELSSTQNLAKEQFDRDPGIGVIAAAKQTAGRGQNANSWFSPEGGLYLTWIDRSKLDQTDLSQYTYQICMKVQSVIEMWSDKKVDVKLPNDLFLNGKKIAGILCERFVRGSQISPVFVGIGINLNIKEFPLELQNIATSLKIETGKSFDLKQKIKELVLKLKGIAKVQFP